MWLIRWWCGCILAICRRYLLLISVVSSGQLNNMFRFTQEPSSGSHNQSLAKITSLVQLCVSVRTLSVLWRHMPAITLVYVYTIPEWYMSYRFTESLRASCLQTCMYCRVYSGKLLKMDRGTVRNM